MAISFTPKKFLNALDLNGIKLKNLTDKKIDRSYFIPRYKDGTHKVKEIDYNYRKRIERKTIEKIAKVLVEMGLAQNEETIIRCFVADNYDNLIPEDLL